LNNRQINIIFFSDTHLGFDYPLRPRVIKRRRGEEFFHNFKAVLSYAKSVNSDLVIHGGDLFFRSKVPEPIVDRVYHILSNFADSGIPIYIVPGNHERSRLPSSLFLNHPSIHIFDNPKVYSTWIQGVQLNIGGFPFIRGDINNALLAILERSGWYQHTAGIKILVLHQAIEGAKVGPGNFTFRRGLDVISLSSLPDDAEVILCGHIHRRQILTKRIKNTSATFPVIYCGSTERTSFAEKDETKGFYHLIFTADKKNRWCLAKSHFIDLPSRPMIDINIRPDISAERFGSYLKKIIGDIDQHSIIRFKSEMPLSEELVNLLKTRNLSQLLPRSLNFTFSSRIFNQE
jgi:DNA repair exonuclease SbcCD nuclease subunit